MHRNQEVVVEPARGSGLADWSKVYLLSFYGDLGLMAPVNEVVQALGHLRRETLLIGRLEGRPAGVVALFRTPGVLGVYCVGTLPEFRGRGVAETLLESARRIGVSEDRRMVIQTIRSDGYEAYYLRRGFKTLYLKALLSKEKAGKGDSEG